MNNTQLKTSAEVHEDFAAKTRKAQENHKLNMMLSTCSPADKKAIEMLSEINKASGNGLPRLYAIWQSISLNS